MSSLLNQLPLGGRAPALTECAPVAKVHRRVSVSRPGWGFLVQCAAVSVILWQWFNDTDRDPGDRIQMVVFRLVVLTVAVIGHELAHAFVGAWASGQRAKVIAFGPGFGAAVIEGGDSISTEKWPLAAIAAGPIFNLLVAAASWQLLRSGVGMDMPYEVRLAIFQIQFFNGVLGLLNAIPVYPLDGGRFLFQLVQSGSSRTRHFASLAVAGTGVGIAAVLFGCALIGIVNGGPLVTILDVLVWGSGIVFGVTLADPRAGRLAWVTGVGTGGLVAWQILAPLYL